MTHSKVIREQTRNKIVDIYRSTRGYRAISKALALQRTTVTAIIGLMYETWDSDEPTRGGWLTEITPRAMH